MFFREIDNTKIITDNAHTDVEIPFNFPFQLEMLTIIQLQKLLYKQILICSPVVSIHHFFSFFFINLGDSMFVKNTPAPKAYSHFNVISLQYEAHFHFN